jgi:hypothetical protein
VQTGNQRGDIFEPMQSAFVHGECSSTVDATTSPRAHDLLDVDNDGVAVGHRSAG